MPLNPKLIAAALAGAFLAAGAQAAPESASEILKTQCAACHLENGKLQRIGELRKTPEGWDMSIARMQVWHKVQISKEQRRTLVKYLADKQGLTPQEAAPYRFLLERAPNAQDVVPSTDLAQMCGRCHSFGRVALQRRPPEEWTKLVHTHLGWFPSIEYSALGRDRYWKRIALDEIAPTLGKLYPLDNAAWKKWQAAKHPAPTGTWRIAGHHPGWGDYAGSMDVRPLGQDRYDVRYDFTYANGSHVVGEGQSVIYSGFEWRGDAAFGNRKIRSVLALGEDGKTLSGRWFQRDADEIGASFEAVRADPAAAGTVLSMTPSLLKAGTEQKVVIHGIALGKAIDLGPGIEILAAEPKGADDLALRLRIAADAPEGLRDLRGGKARFAVYRKFDSIRVEPEFGIGRLGGGTNPAQTAQFEAIAYLNGPDGQPGTADDIRLGDVPATWHVEDFDEKAKAGDDARYAGVMEPRGQFQPSPAGPNPARHGLNNTGDLTVVADVADGDDHYEAKAHLMVTVQRWNKPPLR